MRPAALMILHSRLTLIRENSRRSVRRRPFTGTQARHQLARNRKRLRFFLLRFDFGRVKGGRASETTDSFTILSHRRWPMSGKWAGMVHETYLNQCLRASRVPRCEWTV